MAEDITHASAELIALRQRVNEQVERLFGPMAMVAVARSSIKPTQQYDLWRVLNDVHGLLDDIAGNLSIAADAPEVAS